MNELFQLAYSVFNNKHMALNAECTQRNILKAQMLAVVLPAQRTPKGKLVFLVQSGPGRPVGLQVPRQDWCTPCRQKRHWREDYDQCAPGKQAAHWKKEYPRCQGVMGGPWTIDSFAIRRLKESKAKSGSD